MLVHGYGWSCAVGVHGYERVIDRKLLRDIYNVVMLLR